MSNNQLRLNDKCPEFNLPSTDDKYYGLKDFSGKKALIIIFSCNHCPYVQAYEERIKSIVTDYSEKGVALAAINSNDSKKYKDDSFEEMKIRAEKRAFNFPYLRDEDQTAAKAFGASHTPEIFLFDSERKLVYKGKIDDNWKDEHQIKNKYLREALDELLTGKEISIPETFSIGCTIKWKG